MRRSGFMFLLATELAVIGFWSATLRFDSGFDSLQYQRMAQAIIGTGAAPWAVNPLSYIGIYPGSDSSGVPFLAASFSVLSGISLAGSVLAYDTTLLVLFGLGIHMLVRRLTGWTALGLLAILLGSLAFGLFTATAWALDERSFNVALTPLFLLLAIPRAYRATTHSRPRDSILLGIVGFIMLVSHLSFLLLIPFIVLTPLVYQVVNRQLSLRRNRRASLLYFVGIAASPLMLLTALTLLGVLSSYGLTYQLESSALFKGDSPVIFLLNSLVFLGTRIGIVNVVCLLLGMVYLLSRHQLFSGNVVIGGIVLAGFLGLPVVLYSKDLLMPVCVLVGVIGLGGLLRRLNARRRAIAVAVVAGLILSGSLAFDAWNTGRTSKTFETVYWTFPGVTPEAQSGALWMVAQGTVGKCVYGNNPAMLQQVAFGPKLLVCNGNPVDTMINSGTAAKTPYGALQVAYVGLASPSPGNWFVSPTLDRVAADFASIPSLNFDEGRSLLLRYNVSFVVVDLVRPYQIPLYQYQNVEKSIFFEGLWATQYPVYRTGTVAVFKIAS